jgi:hypothetical protein
MLYAYEFKWKDQKVRFPVSFLPSYPEHQTAVVSRQNFEWFLGLDRTQSTLPKQSPDWLLPVHLP